MIQKPNQIENEIHHECFKATYSVVVDELFISVVNLLHPLLRPHKLIVRIQHQRQLIELRLVHNLRHRIDIACVYSYMSSGATQPLASSLQRQSFRLSYLVRFSHLLCPTAHTHWPPPPYPLRIHSRYSSENCDAWLGDFGRKTRGTWDRSSCWCVSLAARLER